MNHTTDVHDWAHAALQRADLQIESVEAVLTGKLPDGSTRHRLSVVVTRQPSGEDNEVEVVRSEDVNDWPEVIRAIADAVVPEEPEPKVRSQGPGHDRDFEEWLYWVQRMATRRRLLDEADRVEREEKR